MRSGSEKRRWRLPTSVRRISRKISRRVSRRSTADLLRAIPERAAQLIPLIFPPSTEFSQVMHKCLKPVARDSDPRSDRAAPAAHSADPRLHDAATPAVEARAIRDEATQQWHARQMLAVTQHDQLALRPCERDVEPVGISRELHPARVLPWRGPPATGEHDHLALAALEAIHCVYHDRRR